MKYPTLEKVLASDWKRESDELLQLLKGGKEEKETAFGFLLSKVCNGEQLNHGYLSALKHLIKEFLPSIDIME